MRGFYPGSFDPITLGHLDVIIRAAGIFDEVVVGVLHNPDKPSGAFPIEERLRLIQAAAAPYENVKAAAFQGLAVTAAREAGADVLLRGLRTGADGEGEMAMARLNRQLSGIETLFIAASPALCHISAGMVRQIGSLGGDISGLVPEAIERDIKEKLLRFA